MDRRHEVTPQEIVCIRRKYNAGQKHFRRNLGLGEATINSYETGQVPTTAHSALIRQATDPSAFARMYQDRRDEFGPTQRKRIDAAPAQRRNCCLLQRRTVSLFPRIMMMGRRPSARAPRRRLRPMKRSSQRARLPQLTKSSVGGDISARRNCPVTLTRSRRGCELRMQKKSRTGPRWWMGPTRAEPAEGGRWPLFRT